MHHGSRPAAICRSASSIRAWTRTLGDFLSHSGSLLRALASFIAIATGSGAFKAAEAALDAMQG